MTIAQEVFALLRLVPDQQSFRAGDALLNTVKESAIALTSAVTGAFAVDAVYDFVRATLEAVPGIGDLADQTGIAAETIQRLGFAASQSGSDAETLNAGLAKLVKNIGEARTGSAPMIDALKTVGVKLSDVTNESLASGRTFEQVADGIAAITDPAKRAAAATALFGLSGGKLIPVLKGGGDAIRELGASVDVLSREEIDAVGAVDDRINATSASLLLSGRRLVVAFLPLIDAIAAGASTAAKAVSFLGAGIARFIKPLKVLAGVVATVVVAAGIQWLATLAALVVGQIIAAASTSTLAGTYGLLAGAIDVAALAAARFLVRIIATAAPIAAVGVVAALLFLVLEDIYTGITGGDSVLMGLSGRFDEIAAVFFKAGQEGAGFKSVLAFIVGGILTGLGFIDAEFDKFFRRIEFLMDFVSDPLGVFRDTLASVRADLAAFVAFADASLRKIPVVGDFIAAGTGIAALNQVTGPSSSPGVSAPVGGPSVTVGSPSVITNVTINGPATQTDAQRIGAAVADGATAVNRLAMDLVPGKI